MRGIRFGKLLVGAHKSWATLQPVAALPGYANSAPNRH
jgi:hypothetical protein